MSRKKTEEEYQLKSLANCIYGEGFDVPEDLERRAEAYDKYKFNVAKATGYHYQDINVYRNPVHYIRIALEALVRMPSAGGGSLMGKDELKRFLTESVKRKEISGEDAEIIEKKYINYRNTSHRRSDKTISGHSQAIKLFLNDEFLELYKKFFGKKK